MINMKNVVPDSLIDEWAQWNGMELVLDSSDGSGDQRGYSATQTEH